IDGTKIESFANRYSFVWKKSILRHQAKLSARVADYFNLPKETASQILEDTLEESLKALYKKAGEKEIVFVYGSGKRKTREQKEIEMLQKWLDRFQKYKQQLDLLADRNSYSKTDPDASFMRMKDDHMRNGQLKPAYNIQLASSGQFIIAAYASAHPNDMPTLIPFLSQVIPKYRGLILRAVC
ncbi:IS5/IS1182 family transposase, partial [Peptococcus simiae]